MAVRIIQLIFGTYNADFNNLDKYVDFYTQTQMNALSTTVRDVNQAARFNANAGKLPMSRVWGYLAG